MSLKVSPDIGLPLDVAGEAIAILGKRGSGKTNTATVLVEELVRAGVQTVILDPVGAWWGLRSNAAGDGPGLEIPRLGGQHGDVPLEQTAGALVADVALDSRQSLLIDLSDFPTKAAVARFVTDFAERLYRRKKSDSVLHLVLEEADTFAPQRVKGSERMQGAIEQIVRRGRSRGMGVTLITQRSAVLSKDVLTQADVLIVMRTTGPHDLRAIREWIDSRGDEHGIGVLDSLPSLDTGEGWVWNPERDLIHRVRFRVRETFDSSRTPKAGELRAEPEQAAPIDIDSLGEQIRATAEKAKAEDPAELRKQIAALKRELAKMPTEESVREVETIVEVPTPVFNGEIETLESAVARIEAAMLEGLQSATRQVESAARQINEAVATAKGVALATVIPPRTAPRPEPAPRPPRAEPRPAPASARAASAEGVSQAGQRILDTLAWLEEVGFPQPTKLQTGLLAGYRVTKKLGGTYSTELALLKADALIDYPAPGRVSLTVDGRAGATPPGIAMTTAGLQDAVLSRLDSAERRVLEELISVHPDPLGKVDLGTRAGYQVTAKLGGTFSTVLAKLKSLGLIEYPAPGQAVATDLLFLD